ncbi:MAG: IS3 family transposase [Arcanobacterium sp.]
MSWKSKRLLRLQASKQEKFELMMALKDEFPVALMARILGVTRGGFYAFMARAPRRKHRADRRRELDREVREAFYASDQTYGAPRIKIALAKLGVHVDQKTIAASLRRQGLEAVSSRMFYRPGKNNDPEQDVSDACERVWDQGQIDKVWITDFTYLRCGEGWVYLIVVRDAHSRRVLGYAMDEHMRTELVIRALDMAITCRGKAPQDIVLHADRGSQFTSTELAEYMKGIKGRVSAGRTGVCWDNAMAESFWATLKIEHFYRRAYATRVEVYQSVSQWIEVFYNRQRIHTSIGGKSPIEYELELITRDYAKAA